MALLCRPLVALLLVVALVAGCSQPGPKSYRISGAVKIEGEPIPFGEVIFTPDAAQKNSGPQGIAKIQDGKYDTAAADGKGMPGGPTIVRINGMSGPGGKTLCEHEFTVDLPRADTTKDFDVPKKAAAKASKEI